MNQKREVTGANINIFCSFVLERNITKKRGMKIHIKGDERILGDSDFVEKVLSQASEQMELRYRLKAEGWTLIKITERVAEIFGIEKDQVVAVGK